MADEEIEKETGDDEQKPEDFVAQKTGYEHIGSESNKALSEYYEAQDEVRKAKVRNASEEEIAGLEEKANKAGERSDAIDKEILNRRIN